MVQNNSNKSQSFLDTTEYGHITQVHIKNKPTIFGKNRKEHEVEVLTPYPMINTSKADSRFHKPLTFENFPINQHWEESSGIVSHI